MGGFIKGTIKITLTMTIIEKLKELYPTASEYDERRRHFVGGASSAIVGPFGLTLQVALHDHTKHQQILREGDKLSIINFDDNLIYFKWGIDEIGLSHNFFKGIETIERR